jgi:multidrug efflux pump subunit AcrB
MLPLSYIGVFLTFYLFNFNFDQGGYAAFLFLSGIVVNSALYILNDMNNLKKSNPGLTGINMYIKAYNAKIIPILLTVSLPFWGLRPFCLGARPNRSGLPWRRALSGDCFSRCCAVGVPAFACQK